MKVMNEIGERIFRLRGEAGTVRLANESGISSAVCLPPRQKIELTLFHRGQ